MSEFLNDIKWEWEMNHSFSSEKWEELFRRLEEAEKAQAERKTTALTEVCIPCGYIFIDGNDYDTLGAKKAVCCPDCGNENFVTVATIIKQLESANHDYEELSWRLQNNIYLALKVYAI
jgi:DNA-directed RNA polymerase subunit RPC12/RpoP